VKWKCVDAGDENTTEAGVRIDLVGVDRGLLLTSIGRNVASLLPGERTRTRWTSARWASENGSASTKIPITELITVKPLAVSSG
jgi:hypothetical protein